MCKLYFSQVLPSCADPIVSDRTDSLYHPNYVSQGWQIYVVSLIVNWSCVACVIFGNRFLPVIYKVALFVLIAGGLVTVIVLAVLPRTHGTNSSVWVDFENATGYSGGLAFLSGVLNGAFTIGTPERSVV